MQTEPVATRITTTEVSAMSARLSTLWIFVMLNMIYADIFSFMNPGSLQGLMTGYAEEIRITQGFLLVAAMATEIPIAMVLLSRVLPYRLNRWANIIVGILTIIYVIGGGSMTTPHYLFIVSIEVACLVYIIWSAWRWRAEDTRILAE
jgi:hypothetical protein